MATEIFYCRKCGNFSFFKFRADYVYIAHLRGVIYGDITPITVRVKEVECKVCGSNDVASVIFDSVSDIPDLASISVIEPDKRIGMFEQLRKDFGGKLYGGEENE